MVRTTNLFVIFRDRPKHSLLRKEPLVVLQVLDFDLLI